MNTANGVFNEWTQKSNLVRDAGSPQDLVTVFRRTDAAAGTVSVPFAEGTEVMYHVVRRAVVTIDPQGKLVVVYDDAADPVVGVLLSAKNQTKQTGSMRL
jgi:hypothetical protein